MTTESPVLATVSTATATLHQPVYPEYTPPVSIADPLQLLRSGEYLELDRRLRAANAAALADRDAEARYTDWLYEECEPLLALGHEGLALLHAWQHALPESGHAWLLECWYWYHWAYEYRGSGWASSVTPLMWRAAHACSERMFVAGLRALERDPSLWMVPALILQGVSSFEESDWLRTLLHTGRQGEATLTLSAPDEADARAELTDMLARSGIPIESRLLLPQQRPVALPEAYQGKKALRGKDYWLHATLSIHPRAFFILRRYVWFLQPRWGGSHERIAAFVASPQCAHLTDVERDRLLHEIWRDDFYEDFLQEDTDDDDAESWLAYTRERLDAALYSHHRQELCLWLMRSLTHRKRYDEAVAYARQAAELHPLEDEWAIEYAFWLTLRCDLDPQWIAGVIAASAHARKTVGACILYGHFASTGRYGVARDLAIGERWFAEVFARAPRHDMWRTLAQDLAQFERHEEVVQLCLMGDREHNPHCAVTLGYHYNNGLGVAADQDRACDYYRRAIEAGYAHAAYNLQLIYAERARQAAGPSERAIWEKGAIETMLRGIELNEPDLPAIYYGYMARLESAGLLDDYLPGLQRDADSGNPQAMVALAGIYGNKRNRRHHNYREGVRWLMGAEAIDPELPLLKEIDDEVFSYGWLASIRLGWTRSRIAPHELPGVDNRMV
ncbi:DUF4034 domain-containing protein [Chitinilyticum piscinae]|uniref:DUF4034 domain-containing protein n=1 Tax=Chitinilyticum piscinae TaxID=2866724 RepID=A0A8J7FHH5_9NEIS|nr:DUF4034 domain-containing protein [Chitinilyticum piscinae]MBE9608295.1 DUF4034 domain-containing protein [Chitinilyticum piscinae]